MKEKVLMKRMLFTWAIAGGIYLFAPNQKLLAQSTQKPSSTPVAKIVTTPAASKSSAAAQSPIPAKKANGAPTRYRPSPLSKRAQLHYDMIWGVDSFQVKYAESGEMIRFSYRVVDSEKAKSLNDKKNEPSLIDLKAGVRLVVPSLEKVGKLRQTSTPEAGKKYWMAFSNKGRVVKPGDRVNVVIGKFQANGLIVE